MKSGRRLPVTSRHLDLPVRRQPLFAGLVTPRRLAQAGHFCVVGAVPDGNRPAMKTLEGRAPRPPLPSRPGESASRQPRGPSKLNVASETCERRMEGGHRSSFMGRLDRDDDLNPRSKDRLSGPKKRSPGRSADEIVVSASALVRPGAHAIPQPAVRKQTEQAACPSCETVFTRNATSKRLRVYCSPRRQRHYRSASYKQRPDIQAGGVEAAARRCHRSPGGLSRDPDPQRCLRRARFRSSWLDTPDTAAGCTPMPPSARCRSRCSGRCRRIRRFQSGRAQPSLASSSRLRAAHPVGWVATGPRATPTVTSNAP